MRIYQAVARRLQATPRSIIAVALTLLVIIGSLVVALTGSGYTLAGGRGAPLRPHAPVLITLTPSALPLVDDRQITLHAAADVAARRQQLIQFIWGGAGFPAHTLPTTVIANICAQPDARSRDACSIADALPQARRVDELRYVVDNKSESLAYHFIPQTPNGRLVVMQQGHTCYLNLSAAADGVANAIAALVAQGFGVLAVYMPHERPDDCGGTRAHNALFGERAVGSPLKYFLEPIAAALNYLRTQATAGAFPQYTDYDMVGLSGGGWTTTVYAALDPTIRISIPVAGTIPLYLRSPHFAVGDDEQIWPPFYRLAGYPDLYVMGAYGAGRQQIQVLNRYDTCCFGQAQYDLGGTWDHAIQTYAGQAQQTVAALGAGSYQLVVDDVATHHMISAYAIQDVILPALLASAA